MLSIAALCKQKDWEFLYYTKSMSEHHKKEKQSNYFNSILLGMQHVEIVDEEYRNFIFSLRLNLDVKTLIIDQGGADEGAKIGLMALAREIREANMEFKSIATPSGTGTTALFLAMALPECKVYTTPCVGDSEYLRMQMSALHPIPNNLVILEPTKKYHFAKLYPEFLEIYHKLKNCGVEFDLLYAPAMWMALMEQTTESVLYVHSGGVSGNTSMLKRYENKKGTSR